MGKYFNDIPGFEGTSEAFDNLIEKGEQIVKKYKSPIEQSEDLTSPNEFLRVNKGKPYELVEGRVYEKTPTVGPHNKVYGHTFTPVVLSPKDQELKEFFIGEDGKRYGSWNDYAKLFKIGEDE